MSSSEQLANEKPPRIKQAASVWGIRSW